MGYPFPPDPEVSGGAYAGGPARGMKKPGPSRAGWYDAIMQRGLRPRNSPFLGVDSSPRHGFLHTGYRVGELASLEIGRRELIPPVIAHPVGRRAAQLARREVA